MSASNRAETINRLQKVLKQQFQPIKPPADRTVLEHLLYACCLEDAEFEQADEAFARLQESYFDWNEVRVTTVNELTENMGCLPDSPAAATRIKKSLHAIFEGQYSFDLDALRKENLGKAIQRLDSFKGVSKFVVAYVTQNGLGGHAIAIDQSAMKLAYVAGVVNEKEMAKGQVPGLERAIPKNKGVEFFSMLHQLAVEFNRAPFAPATRKMILSVDPEAKGRFPTRTVKKPAKSKTETAKSKAQAKPKAAPPKKAKPAKKVTAKKPAAAKAKAPAKKASVASKKSPAKKQPAKPKAAPKKAAKKKPVLKTGKASAKKSASKTLARKKPR